MVVEKQWTYNHTTKQCMEFSYHPCGQDRDGYDVFYTEQECVRTCLHRGSVHLARLSKVIVVPHYFQSECYYLHVVAHTFHSQAKKYYSQSFDVKKLEMGLDQLLATI